MFVSLVSWPSSSKVFVVEAATRKTLSVRRDQPDVRITKSPLTKPCAAAVHTACTAFEMPVTLMAAPVPLAMWMVEPLGSETLMVHSFCGFGGWTGPAKRRAQKSRLAGGSVARGFWSGVRRVPDPEIGSIAVD